MYRYTLYAGSDLSRCRDFIMPFAKLVNIKIHVCELMSPNYTQKTVKNTNQQSHNRKRRDIQS